jgi:hypothetical protein
MEQETVCTTLEALETAWKNASQQDKEAFFTAHAQELGDIEFDIEGRDP